MPSFLHHTKSLVRRENDNDPSDPSSGNVIIISYCVALFLAAALIIYLIGYFKPPRRWRWFCRIRGRSPKPNISADRVREEDDSNGRTDRDLWARITGLMRPKHSNQGERIGSVVPPPSNSIRLTPVYTMRRDTVSNSTQTPGATGAWPFTNDGQGMMASPERSRTAAAATVVRGCGKARWTKVEEEADIGKMRMPSPLPRAAQGRERMGSGDEIWSSDMDKSPETTASDSEQPRPERQ